MDVTLVAGGCCVSLRTAVRRLSYLFVYVTCGACTSLLAIQKPATVYGWSAVLTT